jgi:5'-nucleotidase
MSHRTPLILVTNDDGVHARGLEVLRQAAAPLGDVVVVAPTREQSAQSHALTLDRPLRHIEHGPDLHSVDGTPADCVYLALFERRFLPRQPDLVLSGINHGHNLGTSVFYSGTIAAAREAALRGIPAIAFSAAPNSDPAPFIQLATELSQRFLKACASIEGAPLLSVNFPKDSYRGVQVTRVGRQVYEERVITRLDPNDREYFWIGGKVTEGGELEGTDAHAIRLGYASITALALEATHVEHQSVAAQVANGTRPIEGDNL